MVDGGFRVVVVNTNDDACQTVHHIHVHVLGGEKMNDGNPSRVSGLGRLRTRAVFDRPRARFERRGVWRLCVDAFCAFGVL